MVNKWIQKAIQKPGALTKQVGKKGLTKKGTIKASSLNKLAKTGSTTTKKRVALAKTLNKINKKK